MQLRTLKLKEYQSILAWRIYHVIYDNSLVSRKERRAPSYHEARNNFVECKSLNDREKMI